MVSGLSNGAALGSAGISALGSIAGGLISNAVSAHTSKKLMKFQAALNYAYAKKSALNSPSWNREGLETAGYNPMLAIQNATSGANSSWASPQNNVSPDLGSAVSSALDAQRVNNETSSVEAQNDLAYANADKAKAEKASLLEKLPFISQREKAEIYNIDKDSLKKESEIHNIDETTRFIEKRYELDKLLGFMGINTQKYSADKAYNASTYAANKSYGASTYSSSLAHPFVKAYEKSYHSGGNRRDPYEELGRKYGW